MQNLAMQLKRAVEAVSGAVSEAAQQSPTRWRKSDSGAHQAATVSVGASGRREERKFGSRVNFASWSD
jgi:hypothetical protein